MCPHLVKGSHSELSVSLVISRPSRLSVTGLRGTEMGKACVAEALQAQLWAKHLPACLLTSMASA